MAKTVTIPEVPSWMKNLGSKLPGGSMIRGLLKLLKLVKWPAILLVPFLVGVNVSNDRDNAQEAQFNEALVQISKGLGQPTPAVTHTESSTWNGVTGTVDNLFGWLGDFAEWLNWTVVGFVGLGLLCIYFWLKSTKNKP